MSCKQEPAQPLAVALDFGLKLLEQIWIAHNPGGFQMLLFQQIDGDVKLW